MNSRIVIVGTSGSGKSTIAKKIASKFSIPHIELDALHWERNWTEAPIEVFQQRVEEAIKSSSWIVDGNYGKVRHAIWLRADTLIWLDYPFLFVFWRALLRTIRRVFTRKTLWAGNRESFRRSFLSKYSILVWVVQTHSRRQREYLELLNKMEYQHLKIIHLRSQYETDRYIETLGT